MLFDLAQTSRVPPGKSERLYASCDLRKTPCLLGKDLSNYQKEDGLHSLASLSFRAESVALQGGPNFSLKRQATRSLRLTTSKPGGARSNPLALSGLRSFITKITASLVTRFKGH
jgi:hypothetical protein